MKKQSQAFTLIELLVVISIIALLIGILLPALGAARGVARISASASNQRQIGIAMATYQADEKEYFPLWQRSAATSADANDPAEPEYMVEEPVGYYWTTYLAKANYIPGLDIYADPTFEGDVSFLDDGVTGNNDQSRVFNWIHYGYNFVWVGSNLSKNRGAASQRSSGLISTPARVFDMEDPTSVMVTSGTKDFNPQAKNTDSSTPTIDPNGEYGAHVFMDYAFEVPNAGRPHARYNDAIQNSWADGHVSSIPMPFTQEEQDATANGYTPQPTSAVALYGSNALGNPQSWGTGGNSRNPDQGNYFDLRADHPD